MLFSILRTDNYVSTVRFSVRNVTVNRVGNGLL